MSARETAGPVVRASRCGEGSGKASLRQWHDSWVRRTRWASRGPAEGVGMEERQRQEPGPGPWWGEGQKMATLGVGEGKGKA